MISCREQEESIERFSKGISKRYLQQGGGIAFSINLPMDGNFTYRLRISRSPNKNRNARPT
jgi:hypothetical protein